MTDAELIELVETRSPEDWSDEELALVRVRIRESSEVRQAVAEAIRLNQALAETFGQVQVSVEAILSTAQDSPRPSRPWWIWGLGTALILLAAAVLFIIQRDDRGQEVVEQETVSPPVAESSTKDEGTVPETAVTGSEPGAKAIAAATAAQPGPNPAPALAGGKKPVEPDSSVAATKPADPGPLKSDKAPAATAAPGAAVGTVPGGAATAVAAGLSPFPELAETAVVQPVGGIDLEPSGLARADLERWLEGVPGEEHRFNETQRHETRVASFDGVVKLKPVWAADSILRFAAFDDHGLAITFWTGDTGVALVHYQPRGRMEWAAYVVRRRPGERNPSSWTLAATDGGRFERLSRPPLDIRHQRGQLVVHRGGIRLLAAPLATLPTEVYLARKGAVWMRSFRMYRGEEFRDPPTPEREVVADLGRPVDLEWTTRLPDGAYWYPSLDGPVELKTEKSNQPARADFRLPVTGLVEYLVEVSGATPGTGVFLANDLGEPVAQLGFFDCHNLHATAYGFLQVNGSHDHATYNPLQQISPYVAPKQWFRLVAGCGVFQAWSSLDGANWTRIPEAPQTIPHGKTVARLGLYCLQGTKPRRIALEHVRVRELTPLMRLVDRQSLDRVPEKVVQQRDDYGGWIEAALSTQPVGVRLEDWLRTAAVATLARGPRTGPVGNDVLHGLITDAIDRLPDLESRLALLEAGAELINGWNYHYAIRHALLYERLGQTLVPAGDAHPYTAVGAALLTTPLWTETVFDAMPAGLVRAELIGQVYRDEWAGVLATARQVEFWNESGPPEYRWEHHRPGFRPLVAWCLAAASREQADRPRERGIPPFPALWRHPLVLDVSKEGFNTLAEMRVALSEKSYADACRIITTAQPEEALGLVPDSRESRLLVSLPQSVAMAMRDEPELARVMRDEFGKLGGLRVQQAVRDGNHVAVKGATVQFHGTQAARQARVWLGDRALSEGDFAGAIREYQAGLEQSDVAATEPLTDEYARTELALRVRLASAFLGRDVGESAHAPVVIGARTYTMDEFERLVTEVREAARRSGPEVVVENEAAPPVVVPEPGLVDLQPRGPWQGEFGHGAGNPNHGLIDWTARQLSVVRAGDLLVVANRFQVVAIEIDGGKVRWTRGLGGEIGHAHRFPMVPMQPVVAGGRVFVRRLTKEGPQLACLQMTDGTVLWQSRPGDLLSDPIIVQGRLLALVAGPTSDGTQQVWLAEFQPVTGETRAGGTLLRFHDVWDKQVPAALALAGNRLVGFAGGTTFACDFAGKPLWLRKATWLPPSQDGSHYEVQVRPPLVDGERIFVLQANARAVDCLEAATGRRVWTRGIVDPRRLLGISAGKVLLEADGAYVALDAATGAEAWRTASGHWLDGCLVANTNAATGDHSPRMIVCRREMVVQDQWRPELVWLDVPTGAEVGAASLESLTDRDPQLGPLVPVNGRLWSFSGKGQRDPKRDIVEIVPRGEPSRLVARELAALAAWRHVSVDPRLQWGLQATVPGWTCLRGGHDHRCGFRGESLGRKNVVGMIASENAPTVFAGEWSLSPEGTDPLRLRVGQEGQEAWRLRVMVAGNCVAEELIAPSTTSSGWRDLTISLPAPVLATFARDDGGKQLVPVVVEARPEERGKTVVTYWANPL